MAVRQPLTLAYRGVQFILEKYQLMAFRGENMKKLKEKPGNT
jgi:hypothetical protein